MPLKFTLNSQKTKKLKLRYLPSNSFQDTSVFILQEIITNNILVSMEISNNGTSYKEMDHGLLIKPLIANTQVDVMNLNLRMMNVLFCTLNVTTPESIPEFVRILHLLILTMKSNPSKSQMEKQFICTIYLALMEKMLNSVKVLSVSIP